MKIFEGMEKFFESLVEYAKNASNMFLIFLGAFLLVSVTIIVITSFAYECKLTKTIDKINKFLERNPRINDDNLVAFNNLMKARSVPKTLRRQWQQFMLYREHPASYYMSFQHCVENPMRNSTYRQQMTVYRIISFILIVLSLVVSAFMAVGTYTRTVLQEVLIIPMTILVLYWLISMVLDLIHSAVSGDLFQNYQYFEINIDKAMLTLPEFVDYEVLFSQDEIRRGIPVLFAYLQKRAIQEQQELEKARLKSVDHEKFDFDDAGLDGSLVLDRAMRETENYTTQRKKYMQEIERVNNEIAVLENNYREQTKEFQRQVQTSKETVENLKEQLEQASSTIEINYIKKQMRDELNRQQLSEKDFDILTDKHNQSVKSLNQEIKHYEEETKKAKEAMEVAMLSEFNTYSVKVYDNLEKIVDEKMQDRVDDYKDQIKGLEIELEEKNEELENVYTRYQEILSQVPSEPEQVTEEYVEELPIKKGKRKKKSSDDEAPIDEGMTQPEQLDQYDYQDQNYIADENYNGQDYVDENTEYDDNQQYDYQSQDYVTTDDQLYQPQDYVPVEDQVYETQDDYIADVVDQTIDGQEYEHNESLAENVGYDQYIPTEDENVDYIPVDENYDNEQPQYIPLQDEYAQDSEEYMSEDYQVNEEYVPLNDYGQEGFVDGQYVPMDETNYGNEQSAIEDVEEQVFDDTDFDVDFNAKSAKTDNFEDMDFDFDLGLDEGHVIPETIVEEDEGEFDLNKVLGLYDNVSTNADKDSKSQVEEKIEDEVESVEPATEEVDTNVKNELPEPVVKRKAGRPRKIVDETEVVEKRKPGRPRKVVDQEEIKPKRKAGRPRKVVDEKPVAKRKPGRPRKVVEVSEKIVEQPKRGRGRPRKTIVEDDKKQVEVNTQTIEKPKSRRGRPRKAVEVSEKIVEQPKRGRGRPRKLTETTKEAKKPVSKRGRPRKDKASIKEQGVVNAEGILGKPKRKAGRPKKDKN